MFFYPETRSKNLRNETKLILPKKFPKIWIIGRQQGTSFYPSESPLPDFRQLLFPRCFRQTPILPEKEKLHQNFTASLFNTRELRFSESQSGLASTKRRLGKR